MKITIIIAFMTLFNGVSGQNIEGSGREYIPKAYHEEAKVWWEGKEYPDRSKNIAPADSRQKELALWYTKYYGSDVGSKSILESSGRENVDHGDEKSYRELGLNAVQHVHRPEMTREAFMDSLQRGSRHFHGQLDRDKIDDDLRLFRHKIRPDYNAAFVYSGWSLWGRRRTDKGTSLWRKRTHRALLDMAFQELLERELKNAGG